MASTTTNLRLKLLGTSLADKDMYFEEWRQTVNGEGDSNMKIIDAAYGEMAQDISDINDDITGIGQDITGINQDISDINDDIQGLKDGIITDSQIDALFEE